MEQKQYQYAIDNFRQVIQNDQNCEEAYFSRGNAYYMLKDYDKAFDDFSKVIDLQSHNHLNWQSYYLRGLIYYQRKDFEHTIKDGNAAIEMNDEYSQAYYIQGLGYLGENLKDKAQYDFNKILTLSNDSEMIDKAKEQLTKLPQ